MPTYNQASALCTARIVKPAMLSISPALISVRAEIFSSSPVKKSKALTPSITRLHSANIMAIWRADTPACCCPCSTIPNSKAASTKATAPLSVHNGSLLSGTESAVSVAADAFTLPDLGKVAATPSIVAAASAADKTITPSAAVTATFALTLTHDAIHSANTLNAGPNRNPSSDIAPSHAKRRARCPSGVYSATSAATTGITAATKNPVAPRSAYMPHSAVSAGSSSRSEPAT